MGGEIGSGDIKNSGDSEISYCSGEIGYYNGEIKISGKICVWITKIEEAVW